MLNDSGGRYEFPEIGNPPPTLQYLQVDCVLPEECVPHLPKCFFEIETPTLFCLDYAFNCRPQPYDTEQHPMQDVRLDWLPPLSSKGSALSDFLLSLSSLRCIFLAQELYNSVDTRTFVESLSECLTKKQVDIRKHADSHVVDPVLPEFEDYIKSKQATMATV